MKFFTSCEVDVDGLNSNVCSLFSLIVTEFALAQYGLGPAECHVNVGNKLRNVCSAHNKEEAKGAKGKKKASKKTEES